MKDRSFIFVSGFGWTGASALVDYLKDFDGLEKTPCGEVPFLNALHQIIIKINNGGDLELTNGKYENIFLAKTPEDYVGSRRDFFNDKIKKFYDNFNKSPAEYYSFSNKILQTVEECVKNENFEGLRNSVTDYLFYLDDNIIGENIYVYDNAISGQYLSFFNYLNPDRVGSIKIYVMDRDPRDQYYELMKVYDKGSISKNNSYLHYFRKGLNLFKPLKSLLSIWYFQNKYYLKRRESLEEDIDKIKNRFGEDSIDVFDFGSFVFDKKGELNRIKSELKGLFGVNYLGENNFQPKVSQSNVGVYEEDENNKAIYWWIEKRLLNNSN